MEDFAPKLASVLVQARVRLGALQLGCGDRPTTRVPEATLEGRRLVELEVTFTGALKGEYGEPVRRFEYPCVVSISLHNEDVLPLKRKELRESHRRVFVSIAVTSIL